MSTDEQTAKRRRAAADTSAGKAVRTGGDVAHDAPTSPQAGAASRTARFQPVLAPTRVDYALLEDETQRWWDEYNILDKYLHRNEHADRRWSFIDGPITANNPMGVHHAWGRTFKDLWQRFNTMRGYRQRYQNGFDCQGLWVEVEVEKELGFKSKRDIEEYGVGRFVERCKERVLRFSAVQTEQSIRLGEWMDWPHSYYTMSDENNYTIWGFLKTCWQNGWMYRGHDVMPWCPRCATGISDMEINEGRRLVQHTSVYVRFPLVDRPHEYLLIWTTTPWTLPANVAAAVNPAATYLKVKQDGEYYYIADVADPQKKEDTFARLKKLQGHEHGEATLVEKLPGTAMLGWRYIGPFDELPAWQRAQAESQAEHIVVPWTDVSADEGTGIVHIATGCGREDFSLAAPNGLVVLAPVDENGAYVEGYDWLSGLRVDEVARPIFENLRRKGYFYQTQSIEHVYPHCWRCGTELIFRLVNEWFIAMDELRRRMIAAVGDIRWIPAFGQDRELDWLRNMEDWMISKKRYWGLALPIYTCEACDAFEVIGSQEELRERAVEGWEAFAGHTPHRPWVDAVKIKCAACGALASRVPDVGNPWLDAGIVPFSTLHYRHDPKYWQDWFPADFITESFPGQFRNWFYSMLVMGAGLEDAAPFKTVLGFATAVDQNGQEMHKSKGNSIPFDDAARVVGADTMRWLFVSHAPEQNLRFPRIPSAAEAAELRAAGQPPRLSDLWMQVRTPLDKLWNVYSFFVTYASIDGFDPLATGDLADARSDLDAWVLSELQETCQRVTERLADFDAQHATDAIATFVDLLSNWYVRRSRRRFWKSQEDDDKLAAYATLYTCLVTTTKLLAPFTPFLAESLYQNLVRSVDVTAPESVHLCAWPEADARLIAPQLSADTKLVMRLVNLGRAAREKAQIRVRQPLSALYIGVTTGGEREALDRLGGQILDELNVHRLEVLPPESDMLLYTLKPRMAVLGPVYGKAAGQILAKVRTMDAQAGALALREHGALPVDVSVEGVPVVLTPEQVDVEASARAGFVAAEDRGYVAVLETKLTPELLAEGTARDLTHLVQEARKHAGLAIEDSIALHLVANAELAAIAERFRTYLAEETLARALTIEVGDVAAVGAADGAAALPAGSHREVIPAAKLGGSYTATVTLRKL